MWPSNCVEISVEVSQGLLFILLRLQIIRLRDALLGSEITFRPLEGWWYVFADIKVQLCAISLLKIWGTTTKLASNIPTPVENPYHTDVVVATNDKNDGVPF